MDTPHLQAEDPNVLKQRLQREAHQHWLEHPVTKDLMRLLDKHEFVLIDSTADDAVRTLAAVRTVRAIRKLSFNTDNFIRVLNT